MGLEHSAPEATPEQCAAILMEAIPLIMQFFRAEMRRNASALPVQLSVPQFRTLAFLDRYPGSSLSLLAEHLGVTRATASTLAERLVQRSLLTRHEDPAERRQVVLNLTEEGSYHLQQARKMTHSTLATLLTGLPPEQLARLAQSLTILDQVFAEIPAEPSKPL